MGKASRKIERYIDSKKDELTQEEIKEQYGKKSITGKLIEGFYVQYWIGLTPVNLILMLACYIVSTLTVETLLNKITTVSSSVAIAHGVVTPLMIVVLFSFIKRPKDVEKPTVEQFLYRWLALGLTLGVVSIITALYL